MLPEDMPLATHFTTLSISQIPVSTFRTIRLMRVSVLGVGLLSGAVGTFALILAARYAPNEVWPTDYFSTRTTRV